MPQILIDPAISDHHRALFGRDVAVLDDLSAPSADAEALVVRSGIKVNAALLAKLPRLRFVASPIAGCDHLDRAELEKQGIVWTTAPGCNKDAVCDYILRLLASSGRLLPLLYGDSSCGIVGYGAIGQTLASVLQSVGVCVKVYDPLTNVPPEMRAVQIEDILVCDVISVHCNLHDGAAYPSRDLINRQVLQALRAPQLLINAARGEIIDEAALNERLEHPNPPHIVLDTWPGEPQANPGLFARVFALSPHTAGHTPEAYANGINAVVHAFNKFFSTTIETLSLPIVTSHTPDFPKKSSAPECAQYALLNDFPLLSLMRSFAHAIHSDTIVQLQHHRAPFITRRETAVSMLRSALL